MKTKINKTRTKAPKITTKSILLDENNKQSLRNLELEEGKLRHKGYTLVRTIPAGTDKVKLLYKKEDEEYISEVEHPEWYTKPAPKYQVRKGDIVATFQTLKEAKKWQKEELPHKWVSSITGNRYDDREVKSQ